LYSSSREISLSVGRGIPVGRRAGVAVDIEVEEKRGGGREVQGDEFRVIYLDTITKV
jgi:hypothetical protein